MLFHWENAQWLSTQGRTWKKELTNPTTSFFNCGFKTMAGCVYWLVGIYKLTAQWTKQHRVHQYSTRHRLNVCMDVEDWSVCVCTVYVRGLHVCVKTRGNLQRDIRWLHNCKKWLLNMHTQRSPTSHLPILYTPHPPVQSSHANAPVCGWAVAVANPGTEITFACDWGGPGSQ